MNIYKDFNEKAQTKRQFLLNEINNSVYLEELTDLGNALRLVRLSEGRFIYVDEFKTWYVFDGVRWVRNPVAAFSNLYKAMLKELDQEAKRWAVLAHELKKEAGHDQKGHPETEAVEMGEDRAKALSDHRTRSQSERAINAAEKLMTKEPGIRKSFEDFDSKGKWMVLKNGSMNLHTGELVSDDPKYMGTKVANVSYDENAECPKWNEVVDFVCNGDEDLKRFHQVMAGTMLLGEAKPALFLWYSEDGQFNKSTMIDTYNHVLGDYSGSVSTSAIIGNSSAKDYHLAGLKGLRMITMQESEQDAHLHTAIVKQLIDTDGMVARNPGEKPIHFSPVCTPILTTNHIPYIGTDKAAWRRILVVPFTQKVPDSIRDTTFKERVLYKEADGIFNWMLEGCRMYIENGHRLEGLVPECVLKATNAEKGEQDRIQQFINELCKVDEGEKILMKTFRQHLAEWSTENGYRHNYTSQSLKKLMQAKGYKVESDTSNNNQNTIFGIKSFKDIATKMIDDDSSKALAAKSKAEIEEKNKNVVPYFKMNKG